MRTRIRRWGLGPRLLAAISAVVVIGSVTAWVVASVIGPPLFHLHIIERATSNPTVVRHAEMAFDAASGYTLLWALLAALGTSVLVSLFLTRRIGLSLAGVRQAAAKVARGDYTTRVPEIGMGAEFDDLAEAFNTMAADLERIETTRRRILGDLAHELRTPVATLDGYLEGMQDGAVVADAHTVAMLREQVTRLARLAEDIALVTTAEEEGALSLHRQRTGVRDLLTGAIGQAKDRAAGAGVRLGLQISKDAESAGLHVDPDRLSQVLTNLVDNALRHTADGGRVVLSASASPATVRLQVSDTGGGIAAEHLPHLFERFYRADTARDREHGGSGVGLAIVRSIVEAHGGRVTAASSGLGRGSTFTIELPNSG